MDVKLTPQIVEMAYRLFLGRDPESEQAIRDALGYGDLEALRAAFIRSDEFKGCFNRVAGAPRLRAPLESPRINIDVDVADSDLALLLAHVEAEWLKLGHDKPHWSVLSVDLFEPAVIQGNEAQFLHTGASDAAMLLATLARNGVDYQKLLRVFEFGCGVGRVTVHLAQYFEHVTACDISASHLTLAQETIQLAYFNNVQLELAQIGHLGMKGEFDLWFSRIVLQHNPPPIIALVLKRALSLLAPGGVAVFQLPTYAIGYEFKCRDYLRKMPSGIEMHLLPQSKIFQIARQHSCEVLEVREDEAVGNEHVWVSNQFVLRKERR